MSEERMDLLKVADVVCNESGKDEVQELLDADESDNARIYLLGALDHCVMEQDMPDEEARELYNLLGLSRERANEIRQKSWSK
jgi:hypothetical protein